MKFEDLIISNKTKNNLMKAGYVNTTSIQELVIPVAMGGYDILAKSPTGSGKTFAFLIPILERLKGDVGLESLIIAPTRELAIQIEKELNKLLVGVVNIESVLIYGGQNYEIQYRKLRRKPSILIGTTGRIMDLINQKKINLAAVSTICLDEVDVMLQMGFKEDIDSILKELKNDIIQKLFFSATIPKEIKRLSEKYQNEAYYIEVEEVKENKPDIKQYYLLLRETEKVGALYSILQEVNYGLTLVFCNTKKKADDLNYQLQTLGIQSDVIHGDLNQMQRSRVMEKFRNREITILIATDVAARGIDVDNIEAVFNYDFPDENDYYIHRIGRTGRAGKSGAAYSFISTRTKNRLKSIEQITGTRIEKYEYVKFDHQRLDENKIKSLMENAKLFDTSKYKEAITEYLVRSNCDGLDLMVALLINATVPEFVINDLKAKPKISINKYYINVGKKDGLNENKVKALLTDKAGISRNDIKEVAIKDIYTLLRINSNNDKKIELLNKIRVNNRKIRVEMAKK